MAENRLSTQIGHRGSLPGHFDVPVILEDVRALGADGSRRSHPRSAGDKHGLRISVSGGFEVSQQAGKIVVRVTTKEPLRGVPPNFSVASPARIA